MSMQGSAMMYVKAAPSLARLPYENVHDLAGLLDQRGLRQNLVEARRVGGPQTRCVGVVREPDDRHVGVGIHDLAGVDARDVGDHEVGWVDAVGRDEMVSEEKRFELAPEEEVDPTQQDRRHGPGSVTLVR
jgi:hypothetical protein